MKTPKAILRCDLKQRQTLHTCMHNICTGTTVRDSGRGLANSCAAQQGCFICLGGRRDVQHLHNLAVDSLDVGTAACKQY